MNPTALDETASTIGPDQAAFYRQHAQRLFGAALIRCRNWQAAEDLLHTAFVRLFQRWAELRPPVTYSYAATVLANCHVDEVRRRRSRVVEVPGDVEQVLPEGAPDQPGMSDRDIEVREAVRTLPDRQRNLIYYVYYEGLSLAETAKIMKVDPRTAHNYHSLAKKRLEIRLAHLARREGAA